MPTYGTIPGLGPKPEGDPEAILALVRELERKAVEADEASGKLNYIPAGAIFEGPAGDRYRDNASQAAERTARVRTLFNRAAGLALKDAHKLADAIKAWEDERDRLLKAEEDRQAKAAQERRDKAAAAKPENG